MLPRSYVAALAPLICSTLAACFHDAAAKERTDPVDDGPAVIVSAATPVTHRSTVSVSGVVAARATADIAFQVPGKLMAVRVDEGDRVRQGEVLASLDVTDYALALDQARLTHDRAVDEARRARVLNASDGIAPNDLDKVVNAEAQAGVTVALARKRLRDTQLASPLSGIVARRNADPGETVPAGAQIFSIVDLDVVHVRVAVPESNVGAISVGATARVTIPSLGDTVFSGRVRLVGVAADPVTRTFAVEIAVPNPTLRLRAGMVAEASITAPGSTTILTVPGAAIVRDAEGATQLFIYEGDEHRVRARRVSVGALIGNEIEITKGLIPGDLVVVGGQHRVRDGMSARAARQGAAAGTDR
jgi:membrane fusion protein, multidrug efflux system